MRSRSSPFGRIKIRGTFTLPENLHRPWTTNGSTPIWLKAIPQGGPLLKGQATLWPTLSVGDMTMGERQLFRRANALCRFARNSSVGQPNLISLRTLLPSLPLTRTAGCGLARHSWQHRFLKKYRPTYCLSHLDDGRSIYSRNRVFMNVIRTTNA